MFKLYDSNDMEINFDNKSLFNNNFSKIQQVCILKKIFIVYVVE